MKMNKKGFTLIELLAVIVVLAIIALIATPIIMNIINNVQKEANARSVEGYMKAYEAKYYAYMLENGGEEPASTNAISADYSGATVSNCAITVTEGKFTATGCKVGKHIFNYAGGKATFVEGSSN